MTEGSHDIPRPKFWESDRSAEKPASTTLHPEFLARLAERGPLTLADIGSGRGKVLGELGKHNVIEVDINQDDLQAAKEMDYPNASFVRASGELLPLADNSVDGALLLGVLSTVDRERREKMFKEASRVVKDNGLVYVAEFTTIDDPEAVAAMTGKKWSDIYKDDAPITGEYGTVIVRNPDGSPKFYAHHFTQEELADLYDRNQLEVDAIKRVQVISQVSGKIRDNWNIWGTKRE